MVPRPEGLGAHAAYHDALPRVRGAGRVGQAGNQAGQLRNLGFVQGREILATDHLHRDRHILQALGTLLSLHISHQRDATEPSRDKRS